MNIQAVILQNTNTEINKIPLIRNVGLVLLSLYLIVQFIAIFPLFNTVILLLLCVYAFFAHIALNRKLLTQKIYSEFLLFLGLWFSYALLQFIWAYDKISALDYAIRIGQYLIIFLIFSQFLVQRKRQEYLVIFFQLLFLTYMLIAVWELVTNNHLPVSRLAGIPIPVPTGPFYNENNFASYLLILIPFLTVRTWLTRNLVLRSLIILSVVFAMVVMLIQGARICIAALTLYLGYYYLFCASAFSKILSVILVICAFTSFVTFYPQHWKLAKTFAMFQINTVKTEMKSVVVSSLKIRAQLLKEGMDMAWASGLMGLGGGNFEDRMKSGRYHRTSWVVNAHNYWMELFVNFGLVIVFLFLYFCIRWLIRIGRLLRGCLTEDKKFYRACFFSFLLFFPLTLVPSSLKWMYSIWIYLAFVNDVAFYPFNRYRRVPIKESILKITEDKELILYEE